MPLILNGTTGISGIDGSAGTPSYQGTDSNTGVFFPAADVIAFTTNGTEDMRIDSSGNVSIGTTSSSGQAFRVSQTSFPNVPSGWYANAGDGNSEQYGITRVDATNGRGIRFQTTLDGSNLPYYTISTGTAASTIAGMTWTERMRITSGGDVGIGTSSPSVRLHVSTSSSGTPDVLWINNSLAVGAGVGSTLAFTGTSNNNGLASISGAFAGATTADGGYMTFNTRAVTSGTLTERMRITSGGEVCVGTTNSSGTAGAGAKIVSTTGGFTYAQVTAETSNANATAYNYYSTGAGAYRFYVGAGGTVYATSTTITGISDVRLKENIQDIDVGLDALMALRPRKFDWKEGKGKDKKGDRGWIAQEFETVFPDMIDEWKDPAPEGEEPYKAVNADLIPVLVKAIQEQQAMIEELKQEVAALKASH